METITDLDLIFSSLKGLLEAYRPPLVAKVENDRRFDLASIKDVVIAGRKRSEVLLRLCHHPEGLRRLLLHAGLQRPGNEDSSRLNCSPCSRASPVFILRSSIKNCSPRSAKP